MLFFVTYSNTYVCYSGTVQDVVKKTNIYFHLHIDNKRKSIHL
jgi:hypothetical protein